ncbi:hypothetical protein MACK_000720 [Theileria orientalis]|uniref:Hydrolase n=1 Tax=Theileria orientalis TaxID=68886 RepID=A0A976MAE1_THEOR|nr:hypothetical protein MACK_000720 [Theileria orientalis]
MRIEYEDDFKPAQLERITHEINLERIQSRGKSKSFSREQSMERIQSRMQSRTFSFKEFNRSLSMVPPNISDFVRPEKPPQYFAIDIDNTFFHKDPHIFGKNIEAFKKILNLGYQPFLCTARPLKALPYIFGEEFFERTGYNGYPGIYFNGGVVYDKEGKLLNMTTFKKEFMEEMLEHIEKKGLEDSFLFWDLKGHYALKPINSHVNFILKGDDIPDPEIKTPTELGKLSIISIVTSSPKLEMKNSVFGEEYSVRNVGLKYLIEYSPMGITKADGIALLMKHFEHTPESCGFIGDGDNDVESMELCDMSFAVANATNYVKRHAKWILHLNHYDGAFSYAMNLLYNLSDF